MKYSWNRSSDNYVVIFNTITGGTDKFSFPYKTLKLAGVSEVGNNTLWIGYHIENMGVTVYTINNEGNIKKILRSSKDPMFINEQLITFEKGEMIFGKIDKSGYSEINRIRIKGDLIFPYYFYSSDLNGWNIPYFYTKSFKKGPADPDQKQFPIEFIGIDLVNYSAFRFHDDRVTKGIIYPIFPRNIFFISLKGSGEPQFDGIYQMKGQQMKLVQGFKEDKKLWMKEFGMAGFGFGIGKGKDIKFYLFPDLKEIK